MSALVHVLATVAGIVIVAAVWRAAILALAVARPTRSLLLYRSWIALVSLPFNVISRRIS